MDYDPNLLKSSNIEPRADYSPNELRLLKLLAGLAFRDPRTRKISYQASYTEYPAVSKHLHLYNIAGFHEFKVDLHDEIDASVTSGYMDAVLRVGGTEAEVSSRVAQRVETKWFSFLNGLEYRHFTSFHYPSNQTGIRTEDIRTDEDTGPTEEELEKQISELNELETAVLSGEGETPQDCLNCFVENPEVANNPHFQALN